MISSKDFGTKVMSYIHSMSLGESGRYKSSADGKETLYASCFALMTIHYLGRLHDLTKDQKSEWVEYILAHQDRRSGYFIGPEIYEGPLLSDAHSKEHLSMHLTAHVLPTLQLLGVRPRYPIYFAHQFVDIGYLGEWLSRIDWTSAWLEGNNLLFVGQFITYLYEECNLAEAKAALDYLFNFLDSKIDKNTGLWGTGRASDLRHAIYGGYHQLILYYYWKRDLKCKENLIDSVLSIQHLDGGFSEYFGGGTCEDVDCVDILVNMYKMTDYKNKDVETALKKVSLSVLRKLNFEGGFYYKRNAEFFHMGMGYTFASPGYANMFSTWFSVHTLFLISEVIDLPLTKNIDYAFNNSCSMGWHIKSCETKVEFYGKDIFRLIACEILYKLYFLLVSIKNENKYANIFYSFIKRRVNHG